MMTAAEYRGHAATARDRAGAASDPELKAILLDHSRLWEQLAKDADLQDELAFELANMPPVTAARRATG